MRFLTADKLFDGRSFLADDAVLVLDNQNLLREIVSLQDIGLNPVEKLEGIISPGFVNAHCHLELSHLLRRIPTQSGLPAFAKQVVSLRNSLPKEELISHMQQAATNMWRNGMVAVGDISNTPDSFGEKMNSPIHYHTFIELLGLNPLSSRPIFERGLTLVDQLLSEGLQGSLAPHAPYSTSKELIHLIAQHNQKRKATLSMHNLESEEEIKFLNGSPNGFEDLYRSLGLDLSWYRPPGKYGLRYYSDALGDTPSLLVHNTFTGEEEIQAGTQKDIFWCFCPSANLYIENRLPDFAAFSGVKNRICIGTDSLASNSSLDVIKEANVILSATSLFSTEDLLRAITYNGALALGLSEKYGQLLPGKNTGLNLLTESPSKLHFIKKIV